MAKKNYRGMKRLIIIGIAIAAALFGAAQESQPIKLHFDQSAISPQFKQPELPMTIMPSTNIKPTFNISLPKAADYKQNDRISTLGDSLALYQQRTGHHVTEMYRPKKS